MYSFIMVRIFLLSCYCGVSRDRVLGVRLFYKRVMVFVDRINVLVVWVVLVLISRFRKIRIMVYVGMVIMRSLLMIFERVCDGWLFWWYRV